MKQKDGLPRETKETRAVIIGNGKSREEFDLTTIPKQVFTFGCNALYRDYWPNYLVSIDPVMIEEIQNSEFPSDRFIIPKESLCYEDSIFKPFTGYNRRSNAGMNAMLEAITKGYTNLYCVGFDFFLKGDQALNNIYEDTIGYGPETKSSADDIFSRIEYFEWFCRVFPNVKFNIIFNKNIDRTLLVTLFGTNIQYKFYNKSLKNLK